MRVESGGVGRVTLLRCAQAVARRLSISTSDPMVLEGAKYIAAPTAAPPSGWRDLDTAYAAPPRRLSNAFLFVFLFVLLIRPSYSSNAFLFTSRSAALLRRDSGNICYFQISVYSQQSQTAKRRTLERQHGTNGGAVLRSLWRRARHALSPGGRRRAGRWRRLTG